MIISLSLFPEIYFDKIDVESKRKKKEKNFELRTGRWILMRLFGIERRGGKTSLKIPELELGKQ